MRINEIDEIISAIKIEIGFGRLLTTKRAERELDRSRWCLAMYRKRGMPCFTLGNQAFYPMPECREWMKANIKKTGRPENES